MVINLCNLNPLTALLQVFQDLLIAKGDVEANELPMYAKQMALGADSIFDGKSEITLAELKEFIKAPYIPAKVSTLAALVVGFNLIPPTSCLYVSSSHVAEHFHPP